MLTIKDNKLLWHNRDLEYKDFVEVREYIDKCLDCDHNFKMQFKYSSKELTRLIDEIISLIPKSNVSSPPKFVSLNDQVDSIKPVLPIKPSVDMMSNQKLNKHKKRRKKAWDIQFGYLEPAWNKIRKDFQFFLKQKNYELKQLYEEAMASYLLKYKEKIKIDETYELVQAIRPVPFC